MERNRAAPSWRRQRSLFPVLRDAVYLDHATRGPLSTRVVEALARWAEDAAYPVPSEGDDPGAAARQRVRADAACLLEADPAEVAFVSGADHGLSLLLEGLEWRAGDQLVHALPRPCTALPAARHLAAREVETVPLRLPSACGPGAVAAKEVPARTLELVEKSLTGVRARMLLLPAASPHDGARLDLAAVGEMCRERGVLLAVDASSTLGALPLAPGRHGIDFLVADGHRWLGSIQGTGLLYCHAGVASCVRSPGSDASAEGEASRFELPAPPEAGIASLGAALSLMLELGIPAVAERILELGAYLAHGLRARGFEVRSPTLGRDASGVVCFASGERWTPPLLRSRLARHGIHVGLAGPAPLRVDEPPAPPELLAVSPHFYNDQQDLDRLLNALQD